MLRLLFSFLLLPSIGFSQMWVSSKEPNLINEPHPSAELQVFSENSNTGVLIPRYENANIGNVSVPEQGMILFNTDKKCFIVYNSIDGKWQEVGTMEAQAVPSGVASAGDVKYSTDENTIWWYDGTDWKEFDTTP